MDTLALMPPQRHRDVVVIDPALQHPVGINPLPRRQNVARWLPIACWPCSGGCFPRRSGRVPRTYYMLRC